jgi:L-ribulokinase
MRKWFKKTPSITQDADTGERDGDMKQTRITDAKATVIGLDFGTQAARAVLVQAETGQVLYSYRVSYADSTAARSARRDTLLPLADDYEWALWELLEHAVLARYRNTVTGICVDATSFTMIPVAADGRALSQLEGFSKEPHACGKLWKYHRAQAQAEEALALAREREEAFLRRTGGFLSCEWALPKLMEIRDQAPFVYAAVDLVLDLCEFLTFRLTGQVTRSMGSMCYKGLWAADLGFPSDGFLNGLRPGMAGEYRRFMRGPVLRPGEPAGFLREDLCQRFGFCKGISIAAGLLDGHTAFAAMGAMKAGDAALVIGTSNVLTIQSEVLCEAEGICGVAMNGQMPGLYGIDAGQSCTGDMLQWYLDNMMTEDIQRESRHSGISPHEILTAQIQAPWESRMIALDWWNGSRNAPCDISLHGALWGFSMDTRPKDIYLALLQSIVCGTREILDTVERQGVTIRRILASGGIAGKNRLLMQEYANLLHRPVQVAEVKEGPALGAALFAALAAGLFDTVREAYEHMGVQKFIIYTPDREHESAYEALYQKAHALRLLLKM